MKKRYDLLRSFQYFEWRHGAPVCDRQGEPVESGRIIEALFTHGSEYVLRMAPASWVAAGGELHPLYDSAEEPVNMVEVVVLVNNVPVCRELLEEGSGRTFLVHAPRTL